MLQFCVFFFCLIEYYLLHPHFSQSAFLCEILKASSGNTPSAALTSTCNSPRLKHGGINALKAVFLISLLYACVLQNDCLYKLYFIKDIYLNVVHRHLYVS